MGKITGLAVAVWMVTLLGTNAAPKIGGKYNYQFGKDHKTVTINFESIRNSSSENATGTILVQLWALGAPYGGGRINGHSLASFKLEGLEGGRQYSGIKKVLATSMPSRRGNYHMCFTVSEYRESGYVITSYTNMSNVVNLGPPAPPKPFALTGPWSWKRNTEAGTVHIRVKKIAYGRNGKSGTLRLSVWASPEPYAGGRMHGYEIGSVKKNALEKGQFYPDVNNTAKLKQIPAGTYHTTLCLSEYNGSEYVIVAYMGANGVSTFN